MKKKERKCLIKTVGGIDDPAFTNELIKSNGTDLIGMARAFIADPDWTEKARLDLTDDIRPCIRCLHCLDFCESPESSGNMSYCSVNPRRPFIPEPRHMIADKAVKTVTVIGGGDAGCELTIQLQTMGKTVDLIGAADQLMKFSKDFWENKVFTEFFLNHEYRPDLKNFDDLKPVNNVRAHPNAMRSEITADGVSYIESFFVSDLFSLKRMPYQQLRAKIGTATLHQRFLS